jgi:hypothetical protein
MWCVKLSDSQRDAVCALIKAQGEVGPSLGGALEALDYARWDDLPDAELPWERVAELAQEQGIGEADVVWDLAAGLPGPSKKKPAARKSGPARKGGRGRPAKQAP